jgi:hypothetical protein
MAEKEYRRLTSMSRIAFVSRSSLWLGKDHLLCIDSNGYTESYKRFYFRDIQAITFMATRRRLIWNWVLGVPTAIFLALLLGNLGSRQSWEQYEIAFYAILASVFGVPLLINNILGPSCVCHMRTAVQTEELPSLNRLRRARKLLNRIRPFITAAQGALSPEEIPARMRAAVLSPADATTVPGASATPPPAADRPDTPPILS